MRISLNLATRPYADIRPAIKGLRIAMGALAVIAIGLGLGLRAFHQKAEEARAREHSLDAKIAAVTQERLNSEELMRQPANAQLLLQAGALNQLFDEKAFSWTLAMEDLETVLPGGVQVTTLEPLRAKDGHITLRLRVVGPRDRAVELVKNLEHSRHFLLPSIVGESSESTGGPTEKLEPISASNRFNLDLLADYNAATLADPRPAKKHVAEPATPKSMAGRSTPPPMIQPRPSVQPIPAQRPNRPVYMPPPHGNPIPNPGGPR